MSLQIHHYGRLKDIEVGLYPDNTPVIDYDAIPHGNVDAFVVKPHGLGELFAALALAESYKERGWKIGSLVLPCIPGARQDRIKYEGDALFTLKYVAKAINAVGFDRVITLDPHSLATTALIDRLLVPEINFPNMLGDNRWDGIIAPDAGAAKRAGDVAKEYNLPVYQASKTRNPETNALSGFAPPADLPYGSHCLVVDDLCDAGGTFLGLAEKLAEHNVTADLFVTHGLFTKGTEQLVKAYRTLYATDSTPTRHERVHYIPAVKGLLRYV